MTGAPDPLSPLAWRHGFFPIVTLLERLTPGAARVGGLGPVSEEAIRFRHDPALTFSAGDVSRVELKKGHVAPGHELAPTRHLYEITSTFLGLTGSVTPLPLYIAEEIAHEDPDSPSQREFLDVFHHRILSLFFRLRSKYSYTTDYLSDQTDIWSRRMLALAGIDAFEVPPNTSLPMWRLLRLSPMLADRARTASKLQVALDDVLEVELEGAKISVQQFVGRWVSIEERQRMKLGIQNTHLGKDFSLGGRMQDRGGKFRIVIGPLTQSNYKRFTEGGDCLPILKDVVALMSRDELEYDLELVLGAGAASSFHLGTAEPTRLGKDSWLGRRHEETRIIVDVPTDIVGVDNAAVTPGTQFGEDGPQDASRPPADEFEDLNDFPPTSSREGRNAR